MIIHVQLGLNQILDLELIFSPYGAILKLIKFVRLVVFSNNKSDRHDITEILLKVVLNTINLNPNQITMYTYHIDACDGGSGKRITN
jgi:hypothetical protein